MTASAFEAYLYDEFDPPFDSLDDLARFILNPENDAPVYQVLRQSITERIECHPGAKNLPWPMTVIGIVRGLPDARFFFPHEDMPTRQIYVACRILDCAAQIQQGAGS